MVKPPTSSGCSAALSVTFATAALARAVALGDEDVQRLALGQDSTEGGVERLHHVGVGRGRVGDFLRAQALVGAQPLAAELIRMHVDHDLAPVGVPAWVINRTNVGETGGP